MEYLLLLIGFVLLIKGADFLWRKFFTCQVSQDSQCHHRSYDRCYGNQRAGGICQHQCRTCRNNDIAVSNVIGSNIFNGLVVVGICAFMAGFKQTAIF